jgi:hypothetical protein
MNRRAALLLIFPASLLALLAAERISTYLLGLHPSEAVLWQVSFELRALFRDLSNVFDTAAAHSMRLQLLFLAGCALPLLLIAGSRRWAAWAFLANHAALIVVATAVVVATNFQVANFGFTDPDGSSASFVSGSGMTWLQMTVLAFGVASCMLCHFVFLSNACAKHAALQRRLTELHEN